MDLSPVRRKALGAPTSCRAAGAMMARMPQLRVERTGVRQGIATNDRGGELRYGPVEVPGSFTPGELLAVALAACNMMSADPALVRRLGDELAARGQVTTIKDQSSNAYVDAAVDLEIEGSQDLDDAAWAELVDVATRSIAKACTVGRTLERGLPHTVTIRRG